MSQTTCEKCHGAGQTYKRQCTKCHGSGTTRTKKTIEVKVPSGIQTGNQLRLSGKGEASQNGGPNGDIYIEIYVKKHPIFERVDNDIYLELPITVADAALGCKKQVPTLYGTINLTIPSGSQTGDKHRVRGKGIETSMGYLKKGDMYIVLKVIIPEKLTRDQKKLFEQLSQTDLEKDKQFKRVNEYL